MPPLSQLRIRHACLLRFAIACWAVVIGLTNLPAFGQAACGAELIAGTPTLLKHPQINESTGNPVHCLTFVEGGKSLATGATSGVLIWDVASGQLQQTLEVDARAVDSIALAPRGDLLVAGGASGIIKVWNSRTFKQVHSLGPTPGSVRGLAISPDGKLLASASPNGQKGAADQEFGIVLWNLTNGRQIRTIPHQPPDFGTTVLAILPDGKQLITAQDRTFRQLDTEKGKTAKTVNLPHLPRTFGSIALNPDGTRLASGAFEPKIRLWDTSSLQEVLAWDAHHEMAPPRYGVASVNYSPDGKYVLSGGMDGMASVWEAATGRRLLELDARGEGSGKWITGVVMTPDNTLLAAAHFGGTATIWPVTVEK